jgi:membrane protease YdiL (CAAX protease family)
VVPHSVAGADAMLRLQLRSLWALLHAVVYLGLPLLLAVGLRLGRGPLGLRRAPGAVPNWTTWRSLAWTVAAFVLVVLPTVAIVVATPELSRAYPMYSPPVPLRVAPGPWLAALLAMALHLLSMEFFFRGFLPAVLQPAVGLRWAHALALLPYAATHTFWPEALAALPFGLLLIGLRLRSGSIWLGYLVHLLLATSLELAGLALRGGFAGPCH